MKKNTVHSFTELECWKACRVVRNNFIPIIKSLPASEKYALADGMKRASQSITENIAEGFGRYHFQENIQFCRHSRGSLFELKDQLITALDEKYIKQIDFEQVNSLIDKSILILNGYIKYLAKAKEKYAKKEDSFHEPEAQYYSNSNPDIPNKLIEEE
jgi:four helix bundle protein